jgi:o-succinylbenzoate---CoA ligase
VLRAIRPGGRVALLAGNGPEFVSAVHAVLSLGAAVVPLHTALPAERLRTLVRAAGAELLLHDEANRLRAAELGLEHAAAAALPPLPLPLEADPAQPAAILFTSGTTGEPRAAVLTHGNFAASARGSRAILGTGPGDRWLACLPLHHVGGLSLLLRAAHDGFELEIHERFDAQAVAEALASGRLTHASLVARMLERVLEAARGPFSPRLRGVLVGGGAAPEPLMARARAAGLPVLRTYGLTEACSQVATQRPGEADASCGLPLPGVELAIEPAGGPGTRAEGEILVRGPTVMAGYLGREPLAGGWLWTGDIGRLDALGRLLVLDRRADLVVTGGENVAPAEVEAVLEAHPAVLEACVVGRPDPSWGQRVCALLRLRRPVAEDELEAHCRARLAAFQVPREYVPVEAPLPRTAAGKLQRSRARAALDG